MASIHQFQNKHHNRKTHLCVYPSKGDKKCLFPCNEEALISEISMHVYGEMNTISQTSVGICTSVSNNEKK